MQAQSQRHMYLVICRVTKWVNRHVWPDGNLGKLKFAGAGNVTRIRLAIALSETVAFFPSCSDVVFPVSQHACCRVTYPVLGTEEITSLKMPIATSQPYLCNNQAEVLLLLAFIIICWYNRGKMGNDFGRGPVLSL